MPSGWPHWGNGSCLTFELLTSCPKAQGWPPNSKLEEGPCCEQGSVLNGEGLNNRFYAWFLYCAQVWPHCLQSSLFCYTIVIFPNWWGHVWLALKEDFFLPLPPALFLISKWHGFCEMCRLPSWEYSQDSPCGSAYWVSVTLYPMWIEGCVVDCNARKRSCCIPLSWRKEWNGTK